ncbi:MAG: element excision factor XisI family protein [Nostoc sp.]
MSAKDIFHNAVRLALEKAGIPKNQIVLAFQLADIRQYTEFAVT